MDNASSNISCAVTGGSGFSTASGKKVTVSEEALNKAMNLLTEKVDQDTHTNPLRKKKDLSLPLGHSITNTDTPASNTSCVKIGRSGFTMASGKKVTVSEEALNKAMNLLTEKNDQDRDANLKKKNTHDSSSLPPGHSITILNKTPSNIYRAKNRSGFSTASGKKVTVSEEALNKAMNLLTENVDQDGDANVHWKEKDLSSPLSNATILQHAFVQPKCVNSKCNTSSNLISNIHPQVEMDVMKVPSVSLNIQRDAVQFLEYNQRKSPDRRNRQHCSMVNLDVPNLSNCSTTQQTFLAQEALDCTRALLEDEVRAAQSLTTSLEQIPTPTTAGSHTGKRRLEEETGMCCFV
uniref:Uncharacterized protein n=1 Tax=Neogobius melanostomus TaxID=47308 RepID=A0A8C6S600_9GOBI